MDILYIGHNGEMAAQVAYSIRRDMFSSADFKAVSWAGSICGYRADLILLERGWYEYHSARMQHMPHKDAAEYFDKVILFYEHLPTRLAPGGAVIEVDWHNTPHSHLVT